MYDVVLEFETERMVGPWKVRSEVASGASFQQESSQLPDTWLTKKAVLSMESFMDGNVEYFVSAPTWFDEDIGDFIPRPLVFRQFSKADRPRAWKNCDLRIQSTLPVLGNDVIASNTVKDLIGSGLTNEVDGETQTNLERLVRVSIKFMDHESEE